jgi:hypothetical protein
MKACVRACAVLDCREIGYSWPGGTRPVPSVAASWHRNDCRALGVGVLFPSFHESNPLVGWLVCC